ncbi:golgin-45-like, partial [Ctenocephalides felis]|uniref:golgin-45-like n=1 Tax=Ctenocephalides felis TaxID=7515 RepID=UPI000E6E3CC8
LVPGSLIRLNRSVYNNYKKKEPKLVLYEPYKAAVKPIKRKNLDCNELVSQILLMSNNEINLQKGIPMTCVKPIAKTKDKPLETLKSDNDKQNLLSEIDYLRDENLTLKSQLAFQAQVNAELKTMLVAAVGEDVETRVHLLTEDKLHLAEALLKSVENLSTHQEQIEWLAGQCEVWRSKFLACSLMVQELANSKQTLTQRVNELTESLKCLLLETHYVRDKQCVTLQTLNKIINAETISPVLNFLDSNGKCQDFSQIAFEKCKGIIELHESSNYTPIFCNTPAEAYAEKLLTNTLQVKGSEAICNAVVSTANLISK